MIRKIERWLERVPEDTTSIILRAGDDRRTESILERWTFPNTELQTIIDDTIDHMQDEIQGRLICYDSKGKQLRAMTIRNLEANHTASGESDTAILVDGLLRMADEQRRFLAAITESFTTMHETLQDAIFQEREHHEELTNAQLAIAIAEMQNEQATQSSTDRALEMVASVLQNKAKATATTSARDMVLNNPDIIDELLADSDIVDLVTKKITGQ